MVFDNWTIVLSCEHGGNEIPARWQKYLGSKDKELLSTHRGWDIGALSVAKILEKKLGCSLFYSTKSRLLVDLNRSAQHPKCLGPAFREIGLELKREIFSEYYQPYRLTVTKHLQNLRRHKLRILHVSIHSFTPLLDGEERKADLAFLYDPRRLHEQKIAGELLSRMKALSPELRYRRNYPYQGRADGFTTALRREFADRSYAGIELEINQKLLTSPRQIRLVAELIATALATEP